MARFSVYGPFEVPCEQGPGGRSVTEENVREFWMKHRKYRGRRGCYVFGMRAGKGLAPGYVGKATRSFEREVFTDHKLLRYQRFMAQYAKGTPVIFLLSSPEQRGKPNRNEIGKVEAYLIELAATANEDLLNIKGAKPPKWGIRGVVRGGKGKTHKGVTAFRKMMGIRV